MARFAAQLDAARPPSERRIARGPGRIVRRVDVAFGRCEGEHLRAFERPPVRHEREVLVDAAEPRAQLDQERSEAVEVLGIGRVADVQILREARAALHDDGDTADHDKVPRRPARGGRSSRPRANSGSSPRLRARPHRASTPVIHGFDPRDALRRCQFELFSDKALIDSRQARRRIEPQVVPCSPHSSVERLEGGIRPRTLELRDGHLADAQSAGPDRPASVRLGAGLSEQF